jgi:pimeloyl-ACP methyl ester carboxylesterase
MQQAAEQLQIRLHGDASLPALVYLPGLHGDWTLVASFRARVAGKVRFVEFTYPRTLDWSLADYARAVDAALAVNGINRGWLLAESFGSQIAWAMLGLGAARFQVEGVILAGGFVRHPLNWSVRLARRVGGSMSLTLLTRLLFCYAKVARVRHRKAPETLASIDEFISRRTELDRQAAVHRLDLILGSDFRRSVSSQMTPVFALTGLFDPIVPWPFSLAWLRRHCRALRATRIIGRADHTVLATAPGAAAEQVLKWMQQLRRSGDVDAGGAGMVSEPPSPCLAQAWARL